MSPKKNSRGESVGKNYTPHPDYDKLPASIRAEVGPKAYAWMGSKQRTKLEEDFCNPEVEEDF